MKRSWKAKATLRLQHREIKKVKFSRRQDWGRRQAGKQCSEGTRSQNGRCNTILAVQESSRGDVVTDWLNEYKSVNFWFQRFDFCRCRLQTAERCRRQMCPFWQVIRRMRRRGTETEIWWFSDLVTQLTVPENLNLMTLRISDWQSENDLDSICNVIFAMDLTLVNKVRNDQICKSTAFKGMWEKYICGDTNF